MEPVSLLAGAYALGTTMYNMYQGYRQENREDNAVQRRVADLQKAGLSPTLAAGSAAASVASPRAEGVNPVGAWADAQNALEQLKQNRELTEQAKEQTRILKYERESANRANVLDNLSFQWQTGGKPNKITMNPASGNYELDWSGTRSDIDPETHRLWLHNDLEGSPIMQGYQMGLNNAIYNSQMLQKENKWYNFNQGLNAVSTGVGLGLNAFSTFGGHALKKRALDDSFQQFQQELTRKQNYDNWRMSPRTSYYSDNRGYRSSRVNY